MTASNPVVLDALYRRRRAGWRQSIYRWLRRPVRITGHIGMATCR